MDYFRFLRPVIYERLLTTFVHLHYVFCAPTFEKVLAFIGDIKS